LAARCYSQLKASGWQTDRQREIAEAGRLARLAVETGRDDAVALSCAGSALAYVVGDVEDGDAVIEKALLLNPNLAWAWYSSSWVKIYLGEPEMAIERVGRAMRLSPHDPHAFIMYCVMAYAHFFSGRYAEAASWAESALRDRPDHVAALRLLASSAAMLGRQEQAAKAMKRSREIDPFSRLSNLSDRIPLRRPEHLATLIDSLRKAGMPE
jgi:adenylate cyclase